MEAGAEDGIHHNIHAAHRQLTAVGTDRQVHHGHFCRIGLFIGFPGSAALGQVKAEDHLHLRPELPELGCHNEAITAVVSASAEHHALLALHRNGTVDGKGCRPSGIFHQGESPDSRFSTAVLQSPHLCGTECIHRSFPSLFFCQYNCRRHGIRMADAQ